MKNATGGKIRTFAVVYSTGERQMSYDDPHTDERLEKVETVTIDFEEFKTALTLGYLGGDNRHDRTHVLRLYPKFTSDMEGTHYESVQGRHYDNDWDEKPLHIKPELILLEDSDISKRELRAYPDEYSVNANVTDEAIEDIGGIESAVKESREFWWSELKCELPDEINLASNIPQMNKYIVKVNWTNL